MSYKHYNLFAATLGLATTLKHLQPKISFDAIYTNFEVNDQNV